MQGHQWSPPEKMATPMKYGNGHPHELFGSVGYFMLSKSSCSDGVNEFHIHLVLEIYRIVVSAVAVLDSLSVNTSSAY